MPQSINEYTDQLAVLEQNLDAEGIATLLADVQRLAGIGILTAGIAQELANLLSIVSTASISLSYELQQQAIPPQDIAHHYLSLIERNAFRAGQIVAMLQGYGVSGSLKMATTDVDTILRDTMMLVERQFREESSIRLEVKVDKEAQFLICDHNRIVQLLVNLLLNARDSMPETGGLIEVNVQAAPDGQSGKLVGTPAHLLAGIETIAISISGAGGSDGQKEILHSAISTKSNGNGTGLGLSVAHEIIRQHHGDIQFSMNRGPNMGPSVTVVLPVRPSV